jgi:adenylyltransferase/sulfurtransferase
MRNDSGAHRRHARHVRLGVIGEAGQRRLAGSTVAVVGLGALGSVVASSLARAGVGRLILIDRDVVELENLAGQILYDEEDAREGCPKAVAAARRIATIDSSIEAEPRVVDLTAATIREAASGVDLILDGTDNFQTRFLVNDLCIFRGTPWVYTGAIGHHGTVMVIRPGRTPCLRCYVREAPPPGSSGTCDTEGILAPVSQIMANLEVIEGIKLLTGLEDRCVGGVVVFDGWRMELDRIEVSRDPACRACGQRVFDFLDAPPGPAAAVLCGRDAVQIPGRPGLRLALSEVARTVEPLGVVRVGPHMLRLVMDRHEISLFPDGRAIVKGTDDPAAARSLYSRLFGM